MWSKNKINATIILYFHVFCNQNVKLLNLSQVISEVLTNTWNNCDNYEDLSTFLHIPLRISSVLHQTLFLILWECVMGHR